MSSSIRGNRRGAARVWAARWGCAALLACTVAKADDGNRLSHLDAFCDPYQFGLAAPKLVTPQWIGEDGVEAVVTLGVDDMRNERVGEFEEFLRPLLARLQQIDGRAPVSIMANDVDPRNPQLQIWLQEGLSLETHTADHPCPCLQGGDFARARDTYERCVDQLAAVPHSRPVAFRFPCLDSQNTPSPRGYAEFINRTTPAGNFLQISSSICNLFTADDPDLPAALVYDASGEERFAAYLPFRGFVNRVENYPYPYIINRTCWEFACAVPDDWQANHRFGRLTEKTNDDFQALIDATVIKRGVCNCVFHSGNRQIRDVVDHVDRKYGRRVRFLTFRECLERLNKNLLAGQPLKDARGGDNGVRLVDLNNDGFLDVLIGNAQVQLTRVWQPEVQRWQEFELPVRIVRQQHHGEQRDAGVRFGVLQPGGRASLLVANEHERGVWHFTPSGWQRDEALLRTLQHADGAPLETSRDGIDLGVRLRDLDADGICELVVAGPGPRRVLRLDAERRGFQPTARELPEPIVDAQGRDAGLRFVDLNQDGRDDLVFSNDERFSVHIGSAAAAGWEQVRAGQRGDPDAVPRIVRAGGNNGAWFAHQHLWLQNEDTHSLPDGVDRRTFSELLGPYIPPPRSPGDSHAALRLRPGFRAELVAAEPLVMDPVAFDWGPDGKFWVVEMADYPLGLDDQGQVGGRVRCLQDTDGDGSYDTSTLFLEGIPYPTGVLAWRKGVLVSAAPDVFYAEDTDGDGRADKREVLYHGFGEGNQQHRVNGFSYGLDNWVYLANGDSGGTIRSLRSGAEVGIGGRDLRIRPDQGLLDPQTGQTQFGRNRDDWGNWIGCDNSNPLRSFVLADQYLRRNPHLRPPHPAPVVAGHATTQVFPISQVLSHYSGYRPPAPHEQHRFTSACSTSFYRDDLFGQAFHQNTFTSAPIHNLVHRRVVAPDGVSFTSRRAPDEATREFLASTDSWFRPTMVRTGPDGGLWVADMYRLVIEHPEWIDDRLEKQLDLRAGHDRGRIYRILPRNRQPRAIPQLSRRDTPQLVAALDAPGGWQRDTAQRLLVERADPAASQPLRAMLRTSSRPLARLHALCTLEGLGTLNADDVSTALSDMHPGVRRHAIRVAEGLIDDSPQLVPVLVALEHDPDPHVQLQLAYTLGEIDDPRAGQALGRMALSHTEDAYLTAAILSSVGPTHLPTALDAVVKSTASEASIDQVLGACLAMAARMNNQPALNRAMRRLAAPDAEITPAKLEAVAGMLAALPESVQPWYEEDAPGWAQSVRQLVERSQQLVDDANAPVAARQAAVRLLARTAGLDVGATLERLLPLLDPRVAVELQQATLESCGQIDHPDVARGILDRMNQFSPAVRIQATDILLSRDRWVVALLDRLESGALVAAQLSASERQRLLTHQDAPIRQRAEGLLAGEAHASGDRQQLVARYQAGIGASGNPRIGALLFNQHCASCHKINGMGHEVGPDLAALKDRSATAVLTAVLDPNRAIEDKYRSYHVLTNDGRLVQGILTSETGSSITILGQQGKEETVLRSDVGELTATGMSLMPTGLEKELPVEAMANLVAFVETLGSERRRSPESEATEIIAQPDGRLLLPATMCRIYGESLTFEPQYGNLGFWSSIQDRALWRVRVTHDQEYEIELDYACPDATANNEYLLRVNETEIRQTVASTGSWDNYQQVVLGRVALVAGTHTVEVRPTHKPSSCLMDLRAVLLRPVP